MHDTVLVRVGERLEKLGGDLDDVCIGELVRVQRLAKRLAGHVLVDEIDVSLVLLDRERASAVRVVQTGDRGGLPVGALGTAAFTADDLECNVPSLLLVAREPDGPGPAHAEGLDGPVAAQDQLIAGPRLGESGLCHRFAN